jgi:hypothetical protein
MESFIKNIINQMQACLFVFVVLFVASCQSTSENDNLLNNEIERLNKENFISYDEICEKACSLYDTMVKKFGVSVDDINVKSGILERGLISRTIQKIESFNDEKDVTALYAINFEEGGFIILSADKRMPEVLAISERNSFETKADDMTEEMPNGVKIWLEEMLNSVSDIRNKPSKYIDTFIDDDISIHSNELSTRNVPANTPYLLSTTWGQSNGYNEQLSYCNFPEIVSAGSATIAIAQIMKYHRYPSMSYAWIQMKNNYSTTETATLIKDIYVKSGAYANGCSTSTPYPSGFQNAFSYYGYSYSVENYNLSVIYSDISNNSPVIIYCSDHAWVCDGYCEVNNPAPSNLIAVYLHMNWGWYGTSDGWYNGLSNYIVTSSTNNNYTFPINTLKLFRVWY